MVAHGNVSEDDQNELDCCKSKIPTGNSHLQILETYDEVLDLNTGNHYPVNEYMYQKEWEGFNEWRPDVDFKSKSQLSSCLSKYVNAKTEIIAERILQVDYNIKSKSSSRRCLSSRASASYSPRNICRSKARSDSTKWSQPSSKLTFVQVSHTDVAVQTVREDLKSREIQTEICFTTCMSSVSRNFRIKTSRHHKGVQAQFNSPRMPAAQFKAAEMQTENVLTTSISSRNFHIKRRRTRDSKSVQAKLSSQPTRSIFVMTAAEPEKTKNSMESQRTSRQTQMYEHITENDLYCLEWLDRNFFSVPVDMANVRITERIKEASEVSCFSSS